MSDDLSSRTVLIYDGGLFSDLALRLSRSFGRTLFQCSIDQPFPKVNEAAVGDLPPVEVITDFWSIKKDIDLFVFPDCAHAGLQNELISQGFPVWGSRNGANLELQRIRFKEVLNGIGLTVGPYEVCNGLKELSDFLRDKKDRYIKLSKFRGSTETRHWIDQRQSSAILDEFAITFGPVAESVKFLVEEAIPTEIEWGLDTYFAGGKYPTMVAHGPEIKDKCYTGSMVKWSDLPDQVREVAEAMQPVLAESGYTNMVSMEIRIDEEGNAFFTDPTCRFPSPAGEAQMELYTNLPEIIWAGAHGECIEPEYDNTFAVECIMDHTGQEEKWRTLVVPDSVRQWVKLYGACQVDGDLYGIPPFPHSTDSIGAIIGLGNTMEEAIEALKAHAAELKDQPVTIPIETLVEALKEIEVANEQGVEFASTEMPEPETVVSES
jgi:hypothetical protein